MGLASLGATDDEISKLVRSFLFNPELKCPEQKNTMIVNTMMVNTKIVRKISFSRVFYVWSGVLLFLHCGIWPLPRGRSNESENNFIGKENILQKGSSESRNKIVASENIPQKVYGAGLLSSAAELQFVMDGVESGSLPLLQLEEDSVRSAEIMVWQPPQLQRSFKTFQSRWPPTRSSTFTRTPWKVPLSLWGPSPTTSKGRSASGVLRSQLGSFFTFFVWGTTRTRRPWRCWTTQTRSWTWRRSWRGTWPSWPAPWGKSIRERGEDKDR